jgi:hypothetical protein
MISVARLSLTVPGWYPLQDPVAMEEETVMVADALLHTLLGEVMVAVGVG